MKSSLSLTSQEPQTIRCLGWLQTGQQFQAHQLNHFSWSKSWSIFWSAQYLPHFSLCLTSLPIPDVCVLVAIVCWQPAAAGNNTDESCET